MKFQKLLLTTLSILTVTLLSACSSTSTEGNAKGDVNILGIYKYEPANFGPAFAAISTYDPAEGRLPSGDRTTWLWGLVTYTDY